MNILGFSFFDNCHDTSAAIMCDGTLVAAAEEERFTRIKHDGGLPINAIEFCLRQAGLPMSRIDIVAIPDLPYRSGPDSAHAHTPVELFEQMHSDGQLSYRSLLHKRALDLSLRIGIKTNWDLKQSIASAFDALKRRFGCLPRVVFYDHHRSHAAAAYFTTPLTQATVITIDGRGANISAAVWHGRGAELRLLRAEPYYNSLGQFYSHCTKYLELGDFSEGKLMGLASYGDSEAQFRQVSELLNSAAVPWYRFLAEPSLEVLGFLRGSQSCPLTDPPYSDFAAAVQRAFEASVLRTIAWAVDITGVADICLGGGAFLNCGCNGRVLLAPEVRSVQVFPAAGDAGLSVGAILLYAASCNALNREQLRHSYLGPESNVDECGGVLRKLSGVEFCRPHSITESIAESLAAGEAVGWYQGRMEFGPRALGARSILADPRRVEMRDRVNRIKRREMWRPLAPSVLVENAAEFFDMTCESPFMLFAVSVRPEKRRVIPAVVHADGTARPQTVSRGQNPRYYDLLSAFQRLTGVPILINTSFNLAGEPIVCSPEDAIRSFLASELDVLALGDYIVRRQKLGLTPKVSLVCDK